MSISFSGLASGLDTSSWIKSLTALKQAKVTVLEEEKEQVLLSQDTLNNIKTFFNSFRSTIEKITDSKFNIPTMDLFAQNLAISANLDVLTATATHEAVEGKYEVKVDKLATNTNAVSGYKYTTTITETTMATLDSKLTDLGASAGNILVNVKSAGGIQRGVQIEENETIGTFITKLEGIGVSAHFNETTGIFSIDVGANDITDIGNTNIVSALHLSGVNEGYKSNTLEVKKVETVFEQADEDTTLGQLGVTDGRITIESNDVAYDIDLATDDTLGELLTALRTNGIEASLVDGRFMIENAKITADTANFVNSFGLAEETAERSQVSNNLTYQTTVVEVTEADLSTKLSALGNGTVVNAGDTVIVKNSNNEYHTITLGVESTLGDLMTGLSNAGLNAEVKNDGTIEITGGTITGGTFDAIEALGLNTDPYTAYVTGNALTETIETFELVTLDTRLVDDLGVSEGYLEVTDSEGNIQYLKIYSGQTIQNLMADLAGFGIDAELEEDTGILTITGGAFETLTDADVNALIASNTIAETEDRYKHGTNLLTLLYGQESINLNQTEVAQTFARSRALYQSVTNTVLATEDSTLQALDAMDGYTDLPSGASDAVFNVRGALVTVAITDTMTVGELVDAINAQGIEAEFDSLTGLLTVNNATIESCPLAGVLNMETSIAGKYVTSDAVFAVTTFSIDATEATTLGYLGFSVGSTETIKLYDNEDNFVTEFDVTDETTLGEIIETINTSGGGVSASLVNGELKIENGKIENTAIDSVLGLKETYSGISHVLGTSLTVETTYKITGESELGNIIDTMGTGTYVQGGYTLTFNGHSMTVGANTTINDVINQVYDLGGTAQVDAAGLLHINGGVLEGTVAQALGFSSVTVTLGVAATGNTMSTDTIVSADGNTTFEDLGFNADSTVTVYDSLNQAVATITMSKTETLDDFFEKLSAQGIEASISDGVISLTSPNGNYITGQIATALGIGIIENESGVNTNQTSTTPLTQTITEIAKESDKLSDIITKLGTTSAVSGGYDMTFNGDALAVDGDTTLASIMQQIQEKGGTAFIDSSGRLQISGGTVTGTVADALGIESRTVTLGVSATGDTLKTEQVVYADQNTKLSELGITTSDTAVVRDADGTSIATFSMEADATLGDFFEKLEAYDIIATVSNGVISFTSQSGNYVASDNNIALKLGIGTAEGSVLENTTQTSTAIVLYTTTSTATGDAVLGDVLQHLGTLEGCENELYINGTRVTAWFDMTLNQLMEQINIAGGSAQLDSSGRLHISGGTVTGSIADALGLVGTTLTAGVTSAGSTLTTTQTANAGRDNTFSDIFADMTPSTNISMEVYDATNTSIGTITANGTTTLGAMLDELEGYGITATLSDGVLSLSSLSGAYVEGALATKLGIETKTTTVVSNMTQSSTLGVTYEGTTTISGDVTLGQIVNSSVFNNATPLVNPVDQILIQDIEVPQNIQNVLSSGGLAVGTYLIRDASDLLALDTLAEEGRLNANSRFVLMSDIDLSRVEFDGIGSATQGFVGTFDGNGYAIRGLQNNVGLFHMLGNGTNTTTQYAKVKNLIIVQAQINVDGTTSSIGGVLAANAINTGIENCAVIGSTIEASANGVTYIGGLIGSINTSATTTIKDTVLTQNVMECQNNTGPCGGMIGVIGGGTSLVRIESSHIDNDWSNVNNATTGGIIGAMTGRVFIDKTTIYENDNPSKLIGVGNNTYMLSGSNVNVFTTYSGPANLTQKRTTDAVEYLLTQYSTVTVHSIHTYANGTTTKIEHEIKLTEDMTINDLIAKLENYNLSATMENGVITITPTDGYSYATGEVLEAMGIRTTGGGTISSTASSTIQVTYTNTVTATTSSKISDIVDFDNIVPSSNFIKPVEHEDTSAYRSIQDLMSVSGTTTTYSASTAGETYVISTAQDMVILQNLGLTSKINANSRFILANDIDMSSVRFSIGIQNFTAEFDGNGYAIENINHDSGNTKIGLFTDSYDSTYIHDLAVEANSVAGAGYRGVLVADMQGGKIENCLVTGSTGTSGFSHVGGMVGLLQGGTIKDSKVEATISGATNASSPCGGLVGKITRANDILIENCSVKALALSGTSGFLAGSLEEGSGNLTIRDTLVYTDSTVGLKLIGQDNSTTGFVEGSNIYIGDTSVTDSYSGLSINVTDLEALNQIKKQTVTISRAGTEIGVFTIGTDDTIDDLLTTLAAYDIAGTMEGGVISFNSPSGVVAKGAILDAMGIEVVSSSTTLTQGTVASSDKAITYTYQALATADSTLEELGILAAGQSTTITASVTTTEGFVNVVEHEDTSGYINIQDINNYDYEEGATYVVSSADDLLYLSANSDFLDSSHRVILANNIDMSGVNWSGISDFTAEFDGNGYVIKNLTGTSGLFNNVNNGYFHDLGIVDCNISNIISAGALVNKLKNGIIENCFTTGKVSSSGIAAGLVAGVTGSVIISDCFTSASVVSSSTNSTTGGLVGAIGTTSTLTIDNCHLRNNTLSYSRTSGDTGMLVGNNSGALNIGSVYFYDEGVSNYSTKKVIGNSSGTVGVTGYIYASANWSVKESETIIDDNKINYSFNPSYTSYRHIKNNSAAGIVLNYTSTLQDYMDILNKYGYSASIEDGIIDIQNLGGYDDWTLSGDLVTALGQTSGGTGTPIENENGQIISSEAITYTSVSSSTLGFDATLAEVAPSLVGKTYALNTDGTTNAFIGSVSTVAQSGTKMTSTTTLSANGKYYIADKAGLKRFLELANSNTTVDASCTFILTADIDMSGETTETGSGSAYAFQGKFYGNGHIISNLTIKNSSQYAGLFGFATNAVIRDVGLLNVKVVNNSTVSPTATGGIVGCATDTTTIQNCFTEGSIQASATNGFIGGIVGNVNSSSVKIDFCWSKVDTQAASIVGGIVGQNNNTNAYTNNKVYLSDNFGNGATYVGGMFGINYTTMTLGNCNVYGQCSNLDGIVVGSNPTNASAQGSNNYYYAGVGTSNLQGSGTGTISGWTSTTTNQDRKVVVTTADMTLGELCNEFELEGARIPSSYSIISFDSSNKYLGSLGAQGLVLNAGPDGLRPYLRNIDLTKETTIVTTFTEDTTFGDLGLSVGMVEITTGIYSDGSISMPYSANDSVVDFFNNIYGITRASVQGGKLVLETEPGMSFIADYNQELFDKLNIEFQASNTDSSSRLYANKIATMNVTNTDLTYTSVREAQLTDSFEQLGVLESGESASVVFSNGTVNFTSSNTIEDFIEACTSRGIDAELVDGNIRLTGAMNDGALRGGTLLPKLGIKLASGAPTDASSVIQSDFRVTYQPVNTITLNSTMDELGLTGKAITISDQSMNGKGFIKSPVTGPPSNVIEAYTNLATAVASGGILSGSYKIASVNDLVALRDYVNDGGSTTGVTIWLTQDLDLSSISDFDRINSFDGQFYGQGHTISNLTIDYSDTYVGLFGKIGTNGKVYGLGLVDVNIKGGSYGGNMTGGIAGYSCGEINNCYVTGTIYVASSGGNYIGGIVGQMDGDTSTKNAQVSNCWSNVDTSNSSVVGGIVGYMYGNYNSISSCEVYIGDNFGKNTSNVAGIVGGFGASVSNINIISCHVGTTEDITSSALNNLDYVLYGGTISGTFNTTGNTRGSVLSDKAVSQGTSIMAIADGKYRDATALDADMTLRELLEYIGAENVSIIDNKLSFEKGDRAYSDLSNWGNLGTKTETTTDYGTTRVDFAGSKTNKTITSSTTFDNMGIDIDDVFVSIRTPDGVDKIYKPTSSSQTILDYFNSMDGVAAIISSNKLTLTMADGYEISKAWSGIETEFNIDTTVGVWSDSDKLWAKADVTVEDDVMIGEIVGVGNYMGHWTIIESATGNIIGVNTWTDSRSLENFLEHLKSKGIDYSISDDGKLTLQQGEKYVTCSTSDKLWDALFGTSVEASDFTEEVTMGDGSMSASTLLTEKTVHTLTEDTTLGEIRVVANYLPIQVVSDGKTHTISVSSTTTMSSIIDRLAAYGIDSYIKDGKFYINGGRDGSYIKEMGSFKTVLKMSSVSYSVQSSSTVNTPSNKLEESGTISINKNTFLGEISGFTAGNLIIHKADGSNQTISVDAGETLGDFFDKIAVYGLTGSVNSDGEVTIVGLGNTFITDDSSNLLAVLNLGDAVGTGQEQKYNTSSNRQQYQAETVPDGNTLLENLYKNGAGIAFVDDKVNLELTVTTPTGTTTTTLEFTSEDSLYDVMDKLAEYGINTSIDTTGRFSVTNSAVEGFVMGGTLGEFLMGLNPTIVETPGGIEYVSNELIQTTTPALTTEALLSSFGVTNGNVLVKKTNGDYATIVIDETKTIGDFFTQIAQYGLTATINDGKVSIVGAGDVHLEAATTDASNILTQLSLGSVVENYKEFTYNTNSDEQSETVTVAVVGTTKLEDILNHTNVGPGGYTLELTTNSKAGSETVTITTLTGTSTLNDLFDVLAEHGITAYVGSDGRLNLNSATLTDFSFGGALGNYLNVANKKYNEVNTNSTSTNLSSTTTASIDGNVVLETLGVTGGELKIHKADGTYATITIDNTKTIADFFTQIAQYGLNGTIGDDGIITISGVGDVYLESVADGSNIIDKLGLADVVRNTSIVTSNTNSDKQTDISTGSANGSTKLGDLNGITNYVLEVSTKSNTGDLSTTLTFTTEDTLNDVFDKLAELGITATIGADGRISMNGEDLSDFTIGGGLGTFLMGSYEKVYDKVTTNNVSANLLYTAVENMNNDTKLSDLGVTNADGFELEINDVFYTLTISETATIGEFRDLLANYGIRSDVFSGKLSLSADGIVRLRDKSGTDIITDLGLDNMTGGNVSQESSVLGGSDTNTNVATMSARISELTDSSGNSLGITGGEIYVYQDGTRNLVNINVNDTLETLAAKLSQYGITMGIAQNGQIYFDGNNNSYLTTDGLTSATSSNILQKLNIETWETRYNSTSEVLDHEEQNDVGVSGDTKLVDLRNADGDSLGITTGEYTVFSNGVRTTETITDDTTVDDFIATMATYGMVAQIDSSGQINIGAQNNTYLATSASAGDNTNAIDVLFEEWNFVNIYTSNNLEIPEDVTVAVSKTTKLADINEGAYEDGYITVVHNGVQTNISLTADDTVGTLMDELALYGFDCVINDAGQLIVKNTGNSILQNYSGTDKASNALEILGVDLDNWITTNLYTGQAIDVIKETDKDAAADRNTKLSKLGVTTGEYNIYSNGVKYTALISSDETVGSFLDTLAAFGIQANIVDNGTYSVLQLQGNGDSYIAKTASAVNQSNVVDVLFPPIPGDATYNYSADLQTSTLVTTHTSATEDTLLSALDVTWGNDVLKAEGVLSVTVDGETSYISIAADETIGTLLSKFRMLGLEASINNGELLIQSGHSVFTINSDGTTSSLLPNLGIAYHDDLGGYAASSAVVEQTVTWDEVVTESVAEYADENTVMSLLNISSGTLSVYKNGQRATIQIDQDETFGMLQARVATALSGVVVEVDDTGYLTFSSTNGDSVEVGATTDTSNFSAICGLSNDKSGTVKSARQLYKVNGDSLVTSTDLFRKEDVTEGTFIIGNATFTIDNTTTLSSIISQINASDDANATAQWDSIDGKLVITSRTTGSAFINIEAGTSNFTDVMGLTKTEVDAVSGDQITRILVDAQTIGDNAQFSINGTHFTSTSNTITSDLSRIQGLTINLKGVTGEGGSTTLTVERDKETLATAVSDIVDAYNELIENVDKEVARGAQLADQSTLKMIRNQIRSLMTSSLSGMSVFKNLDAVGISADKASANNISTEKVNVLNFDKDRFLSAFDADRTALKQLLVGTDSNLGIFSRIENVLESALTGVSGYFESANRSYQKEISRIDKKIERANKEVERYKARLEAKFSAMDLLIAKMQNQYSSFLG